MKTFKISPFYQFTTALGTLHSKGDLFLCALNCSRYSADINTSVTLQNTSFGFDILHMPSGFTLSSLSQLARGKGEDVKVKIIQVCYAFGEGVKKAQSEGEIGLDLNLQNKINK